MKTYLDTLDRQSRLRERLLEPTRKENKGRGIFFK